MSYRTEPLSVDVISPNRFPLFPSKRQIHSAKPAPRLHPNPSEGNTGQESDGYPIGVCRVEESPVARPSDGPEFVTTLPKFRPRNSITSELCERHVIGVRARRRMSFTRSSPWRLVWIQLGNRLRSCTKQGVSSRAREVLVFIREYGRGVGGPISRKHHLLVSPDPLPLKYERPYEPPDDDADDDKTVVVHGH